MTPPPQLPTDGSSDHERLLAARAADGDNGAIEKLYDRYEQRLFDYCNRITANREDAADASQEAFCNVIQRLPGVDVSQLNFGAYLFTAARNACLDIIAQRKRAIATDEVPEPIGATIPLELDPERAALTEDQKRAARAANDKLPEKQRTVLALREVAELSYDDIADAMEMNANSVAQLISRARLNFFKQLRVGAVVIAPLDEAGERAIELAVARQDGRIADDELSWLEQHLRESESSRINVEAIHESTLIYRAIGPVAVVTALREATIAKASELASKSGQAGGAGGGSSATTSAIAPGVATGATDSAGASEPPPGATDSTADITEAVENRRRRRAAVTGTLVLALLLAIFAVGSLGDDDVQRAEPASESLPAKQAEAVDQTGEPRNGKPDKPDTSQSQTGGSESNLQAGSGSPADDGEKPTRKRKKKPGAGTDDSATEPPPATVPPAEPPPAEPTGPTTRPPRPPGPKVPSGPSSFCSVSCSEPPVP